MHEGCSQAGCRCVIWMNLCNTAPGLQTIGMYWTAYMSWCIYSIVIRCLFIVMCFTTQITVRLDCNNYFKNCYWCRSLFFCVCVCPPLPRVVSGKASSIKLVPNKCRFTHTCLDSPVTWTFDGAEDGWISALWECNSFHFPAFLTFSMPHIRYALHLQSHMARYICTFTLVYSCYAPLRPATEPHWYLAWRLSLNHNGSSLELYFVPVPWLYHSIVCFILTYNIVGGFCHDIMLYCVINFIALADVPLFTCFYYSVFPVVHCVPTWIHNTNDESKNEKVTGYFWWWTYACSHHSVLIVIFGCVHAAQNNRIIMYSKHCSQLDHKNIKVVNICD